MTAPTVDLGPFVQRRELKAQEQRIARAAYAYGVDLRRTHFLELSSVGEPLMRFVDRGWNRLAASLDDDVLTRAESGAPDALLQEVARTVRLLRAPLPTVRLVRSEHKKEWPLATPLGTTKGAIHWLILDADGLMALSPSERAFHLGSALAHLQCDHGPYFAATLAAHRNRRAASLVRASLSPWTRVSVFSADRAGLLAAGDLEPALAGARRSEQDRPPWYPVFPKLRLREQALEEFENSNVVRQLRGMETDESAGGTTEADGAQSPAPDSETTEASTGSGSTPPPASQKPDGNGAQAGTVEQALQGWSLARCDARLTRKLGLL